MALDSNNHLITVMMELIQEMWVISREMLSMLKETINIVGQYQDQLMCLQRRCPKATKNHKKSWESKHINGK